MPPGVADGSCGCREVCGEHGDQGFRAGRSRLGEQSAECGRAGCGWTSGGEDVEVSGLRDFLPVAVESGGLRSITL